MSHLPLPPVNHQKVSQSVLYVCVSVQKRGGGGGRKAPGGHQASDPRGSSLLSVPRLLRTRSGYFKRHLADTVEPKMLLPPFMYSSVQSKSAVIIF